MGIATGSRQIEPTEAAAGLGVAVLMVLPPDRKANMIGPLQRSLKTRVTLC